jgi:Fe-S-cluster containining protein
VLREHYRFFVGPLLESHKLVVGYCRPMSNSHKIRVPRQAQWACRSCAACCHGYEYGPVEKETIDVLKEKKIEELWPPAQEGWLQVQQGQNGQEAYFLLHRNGHCVFLRPDKLCAIHAMWGEEAKPGFCREFPHHIVHDPKGLVVAIRPTCKGLIESFDDGDPIFDKSLLELPRVVPRQVFRPTMVSVFPGIKVSLDQWMEWEEKILDQVNVRIESPQISLSRVRGILAVLSGAQLPTPNSERFDVATRALVVTLHKVMVRVMAQAPPGKEHQVAFAAEATERLGLVLDRMEEGRETPAMDERGKRYFHLLLRSWILTKRFQAMGGVAEGLGDFILGVTVSRLLANPTDGVVQGQDMAPIFADWTRFVAIDMVQHVLRAGRPALLDLFLHAPSKQ